MDIQVLKSGRVLYRMPDELAIFAIEAGLATQHFRKPKEEPLPQWGIRRGVNDDPIALCITVNDEQINVGGPPTGLLERCKAALGGRKAAPIPEELLARYRAGWAPETGRSF